MEGSDSAHPYDGARPSKFRYKSESSRRAKRHRSEDPQVDVGRHRSKKRHRTGEDRRERLSSHDSLKRKHKYRSGRTVYDRTFSRNGEYEDPDHRQRESLYDGLDEAWYTAETDGFDADEAFRESLFDAMADDEGAAYWEGVYGQPIHVYSNTKTGPDGLLERMTDEEYAEHVRGKMWEKSHQHIVEEREAYEKKRKRASEEHWAKEDEEREEIRRRVRDTLRKAEMQKKAAETVNAWSQYVKKWEKLKQHTALAEEVQSNVQHFIPWPVTSGKLKQVSKEEVERFFQGSSAWEDSPSALLKIERVRWHPDKMQQRFGQHIDAETMQSVTAVFQVVDNLWTKYRKPK